jgi:simple sugar transport system permease protein
LSQVNANWFQFAIGFLTVVAVVGNSWLRRTARRIKLQVDYDSSGSRVSRSA